MGLLEYNKSEFAYKQIKGMIHREQLSSYQPISENRLATELNMSRTPIRSALKLLEKEGYVKIVPKLGVYLQDLSDEEVDQLYDIRKALERFVIRKIIKIITSKDIKILQKMIESQKEAYEKNDPYSFMYSDQQFHLYFFGIYNNPKMIELYSQFQDRVFLIGLRACKYEGRMGPSIQEHICLVSELGKNNLDAALVYMTKNIRLRSDI